MNILQMTATFGKLDRATLTPGPGLTLIEAPNEGGKSTWVAFLRAMFYGVSTRERDKAGFLAEKNRYQPWSGAPMEGSVDLVWKGQGITLRRGPKGNTPFGAFEAVYTATQEKVPFLTAENCGETLLGVSREVYERTAFVGQGGAVLTHSDDLEKRIAALATSGEEDVSFTQVERRLKDWLNRRRHNRTGLIPKLEAELEDVEQKRARQEGIHRQAESARQEKLQLEAQLGALDASLAAHAAARAGVQAQKYAQAQGEVSAAKEALEAAQAAAARLPDREELRKAQGDLAYLNTLEANRRQARQAVGPAQEAAKAAREAAYDPAFADLDPVSAQAKAQGDCAAVKAHLKSAGAAKNVPFIILGIVLAGALVWLLTRSTAPLWLSLAGALLGALLVEVPTFFMAKSHGKKAAALLARYDAQTPEDILIRAETYRKNTAAAEEAERQAADIQRELDKLTAQHGELTGQLLALARSFAPEVSDIYGVSAALSRALQQGERLTAAQLRYESAQKLLAALPVPEAAPKFAAAAPPEGDPGELSARRSAAAGELQRVNDAFSRLTGELHSLGDPAQLSARRDALLEELDRRKTEFDALSAALESLTAADGQLRERFSPAVNQRAGEYLSALTGGKYAKAALTRQFQALAQEEGAVTPRPDLSLSGGTVEQLYLAARLAVCELALPTDEPCPLVLDDALDAFDDGRMALALNVLTDLARTRQVLLFSCHHREWAALEGTADTARVKLGT